MVDRNELSRLLPVARWTIAGSVIGIMVSAVICYLQPKMFRSQALIDAKEKPGRVVDLAPIHAAQAMRLTGDQIEWDKPVAETIAKLCKNTRITASKDGVMISVLNTNKFDAREIAFELAWLFRGMDAEEALANFPTELPSLTEQDHEMMSDRRVVEQIMKDESRQDAGLRYFEAVPLMAHRGSPEALALWQSESFQRQWKFREDLAEKLAGGPSFTSPRLPIIGYPELSDMPSSPRVALYLDAGLLSGLVLGLIVGIRRSDALESSRDGGETPGDNEFPNLPPARPPGRQSTPEDEW
ncbi:MAG: hypothetical protein V4819_15115 [Verrucomicrobiota bacterium]